MTITIDGPTASGKSSIGRMLAKKLNYYYIYSGLLYRALAYVLMQQYGYQLETLPNVSKKDLLAILNSKRFKYHYHEKEAIIFDKVDITCKLKDSIIDQAASIVSTNKDVRTIIDDMQRSIAKEHNAVIDGRDAGTVVFPQATYKFFLTADPKIRAERWCTHQMKCGNNISLNEAIKFLSIRDTRDSTRINSPLKKAEDSIEIDNSNLNLDETLHIILEKIKQ